MLSLVGVLDGCSGPRVLTGRRRLPAPGTLLSPGGTQKVLEHGGGFMGPRLESSAAWGAAAAPRVSFGVLFWSDCLAQGGDQDSARTWVLHLGMRLPIQVRLGLLPPASPPWSVSSALIQDRNGAICTYLGGPPYSFPQHELDPRVKLGGFAWVGMDDEWWVTARLGGGGV